MPLCSLRQVPKGSSSLRSKPRLKLASAKTVRVNSSHSFTLCLTESSSTSAKGGPTEKRKTSREGKQAKTETEHVQLPFNQKAFSTPSPGWSASASSSLCHKGLQDMGSHLLAIVPSVPKTHLDFLTLLALAGPCIQGSSKGRPIGFHQPSLRNSIQAASVNLLLIDDVPATGSAQIGALLEEVARHRPLLRQGHPSHTLRCKPDSAISK